MRNFGRVIVACTSHRNVVKASSTNIPYDERLPLWSAFIFTPTLFLFFPRYLSHLRFLVMSTIAPSPWGVGHALSNLAKGNFESNAYRADTEAQNEDQPPTEHQAEQIVHDLARQMSTVSSVARRDTAPLNPFHKDVSDSRIDPNSADFSAKAWLKSVLAIQSRDPQRCPGRTAGVSFTNLSVHGYGSATDYQKTVGNVWLDYFGSFLRVIGVGKKLRKIQILRNFEGLVKSGEMLVVLGRPGRQVLHTAHLIIRTYYI